MADGDEWTEDPWTPDEGSGWPDESSYDGPLHDEIEAAEHAWREYVITRLILSSDRLACSNLLEEADRLEERAAELRESDHQWHRYGAWRLGRRASRLRQGVGRLLNYYKGAGRNGA